MRVWWWVLRLRTVAVEILGRAFSPLNLGLS